MEDVGTKIGLKISPYFVRGFLRRVVAAQHVLPQLVAVRPRRLAIPDPLFGPNI